MFEPSSLLRYLINRQSNSSPPVVPPVVQPQLSPSQSLYRELLNNPPDYQPSKYRKILAGVAGALSGLGGGPLAGINSSKAVLDAGRSQYETDYGNRIEQARKAVELENKQRLENAQIEQAQARARLANAQAGKDQLDPKQQFLRGKEEQWKLQFPEQNVSPEQYAKWNREYEETATPPKPVDLNTQFVDDLMKNGKTREQAMQILADMNNPGSDMNKALTRVEESLGRKLNPEELTQFRRDYTESMTPQTPGTYVPFSPEVFAQQVKRAREGRPQITVNTARQQLGNIDEYITKSLAEEGKDPNNPGQRAFVASQLDVTPSKHHEDSAIAAKKLGEFLVDYKPLERELRKFSTLEKKAFEEFIKAASNNNWQFAIASTALRTLSPEKKILVDKVAPLIANFATDIIRKESGAAYSPQEFYDSVFRPYLIGSLTNEDGARAKIVNIERRLQQYIDGAGPIKYKDPNFRQFMLQILPTLDGGKQDMTDAIKNLKITIGPPPKGALPGMPVNK